MTDFERSIREDIKNKLEEKLEVCEAELRCEQSKLEYHETAIPKIKDNINIITGKIDALKKMIEAYNETEEGL